MGVKQLQSEESSRSEEQGIQHQYETLSSLFEKTDAFSEKGITLLQQLKQEVWSKLCAESTNNEIQIMKRYDEMVGELQLLVRKHSMKQTAKKSST